MQKSYIGVCENGYARPGTGDDFGEYSYIYTECGNWWYSVNTDPMHRDGCICPKCGKLLTLLYRNKKVF